jgi:hypothetical protein
MAGTLDDTGFDRPATNIFCEVPFSPAMQNFPRYDG